MISSALRFLADESCDFTIVRINRRADQGAEKK